MPEYFVIDDSFTMNTPAFTVKTERLSEDGVSTTHRVATYDNSSCASEVMHLLNQFERFEIE